MIGKEYFRMKKILFIFVVLIFSVSGCAMQADFEGRLTQIATDVQIMQGGVEENSHRLTELTESSEDHDAAIQELSRRLDNLEGLRGEGNKQQGTTIMPEPPVTQTVQQPVQPTAGRPSGSTAP